MHMQQWSYVFRDRIKLIPLPHGYNNVFAELQPINATTGSPSVAIRQ